MKKTRIRVCCLGGSSLGERFVAPRKQVIASSKSEVWLLVVDGCVSTEKQLDANGWPVIVGAYIAVDVVDEDDRTILCNSTHPYTGEDRIFRVWK